MPLNITRGAFTGFVAISGAIAIVLAMTAHARPQQTQGRGQPQPPPPTLGLDHGTLDFDTPHFTLKLVKDSQTIAALEPKGAKGADANTPFDFTPADQLTARQGDRFNHLGDIHIRLKQDGWQDGAWVDLASSNARKPVEAMTGAPKTPAGGKLLAAAILTPTMSGTRANLGAAAPAGAAQASAPVAFSSAPVEIARSWLLDASGQLVLHFEVKNTSRAPVVIGGLGFPVVFNNMIQNFVTNRARTLPQAHEICSFFDPYVGRDAGYLQVTRLSGAGPALVVVPENGTRTPFEAFRPLNDASRRGQTFEGAFEWTTHSQGYAENEWKNADPWNPPTSVTLAPGQSRAYGLRFLVADAIPRIEQTLAAAERPVAVGIPGYIVPMDLDAKLFLSPGKRKVARVDAEPAGALNVTPAPATKGGQQQYIVRGTKWGRARVTITYSDGSVQTIHYNVTKPAQQAVADMGRFLTTKAWFTDETDPFQRAPSVMTYDRANNRVVTQDTRVWIAGLSDEGGVGAWLAAMMKAYGQPDKSEVDKLAQFVDKVIWGRLQYSEGPRMYGVKKSLFFYQPDLMPNFQYQQGNWTTWTSWNKQAADSVDRAYDYPHVVAAYWTMYRLARNHPGLVTTQKWEWYLDKAFNTVKYMTGGFAPPGGRGGVGYVNVGLMNGDIFVFLLDDLKREAWKEQSEYLEGAMKRRADRWNGEAYPFGSEMAWDSTGQEEIFAWTNYFGYKDKALVSLSSILGYMPTVPHWGYNGNARRYWDFFYGAAPGGTTERQIHHYGSGLNSIPVLAHYREHPDDYYLLRIGYGGSMGALTNIDEDGFPSAAFHSYPQNLRWDTYTGDYGPNFFGHAVTTGTYVINHPEYGWQAFGGNVTVGRSPGVSAPGSWVTVQPLDSLRRRIYIAPLGLYLTLDAGTFESVAINPATRAVRLTLSPAGPFTPSARLRIEQPAKVAGVGTYATPRTFAFERGAVVIPLGAKATVIELTGR
ncbi:MAG TPA: DUF5695 domain-containing protein [Vicinamibacterales bacterium]|nr:DUF5695 domain-containing protein [Vicinamibacterales bacterium]